MLCCVTGLVLDGCVGVLRWVFDLLIVWWSFLIGWVLVVWVVGWVIGLFGLFDSVFVLVGVFGLFV